MLFALAYGSFGDLLETAKLAVKIVAVLHHGSKLSQERSILVAELKALNSHLITLAVIASGVHVDPSCSHSLSVVACVRSEVDSCRTVLTRFLIKLSTPRKGFQAITSVLTEESDLARFRNELARPLDMIRTLMLTLNLLVPWPTVNIQC
jgi:hypothetical protein